MYTKPYTTVDISYIKDRYDTERWIKNYEGIYSIDTSGTIRRYRDIKGLIEVVILKPYRKNKHGFQTVRLNKNGDVVIRYLHKLVAQTFLSNPNRQVQVKFLDGNKNNCSLSNLSYSNSNSELPESCSWLEGYEGYYYQNKENIIFNKKGAPLKIYTQDGRKFLILYKDTVIKRKYL